MKGRILLFSLSLQNNNGLHFVLLLPYALCGPCALCILQPRRVSYLKMLLSKQFSFQFKIHNISLFPGVYFSLICKKVKDSMTSFDSAALHWPKIQITLYYYYYYPCFYLSFDIVHTIVVQLCLMKSSHYIQILVFFSSLVENVHTIQLKSTQVL